ncbi:MAG TPA: hypothetical protein VH682_03320 [Gemmataceae bacterium]|jgi:hypothetical protein
MKEREKRRAVVLIPGVVNAFDTISGQRIAQAVNELGFKVDVCTLASCPVGEYDWCMLAVPPEAVLSVGDDKGGMVKMRALRRLCKVVAATFPDRGKLLSLEKFLYDCEAIGVDAMLDLGLHDQCKHLPLKVRGKYQLIMAGLTPSEMRALDETECSDTKRTIPWAFVGHYSPDQVGVIGHLVRTVDPSGFIYVPHLSSTCPEKPSCPLNYRQLDAVLRRTRYLIWWPHEGDCYSESERLRMTLLAGAVPVKLLAASGPVSVPGPFDYLMMPVDAVGQMLASLDFEQVRQRFRADFRQLKGLKVGLAGHLVDAGLVGPEEVRDGGVECLGRSRLPSAA